MTHQLHCGCSGKAGLRGPSRAPSLGKPPRLGVCLWQTALLRIPGRRAGGWAPFIFSKGFCSMLGELFGNQPSPAVVTMAMVPKRPSERRGERFASLWGPRSEAICRLPAAEGGFQRRLDCRVATLTHPRADLMQWGGGPCRGLVQASPAPLLAWPASPPGGGREKDPRSSPPPSPNGLAVPCVYMHGAQTVSLQHLS